MSLRTRGLPFHSFLGYGLLIGLLGAVYWATLLPGVGYSGDTAKFQFIGKVLGTPHATGYPTYLVLNHFFVTLFPLGSLAAKANLLSAVFSIGATLVLFRILLALEVSGFIAFVSALTFGLTPTLWLESVVAEVYTLHLLYVALVLYFFIRWAQTKQDRHFYTATAIYALSFGNHLTTVTLLPAILYLVWATDRRAFLDRKKLLWVGGFILLSALQYTYILWRVRNPATTYLEMRPANLQEFAWYMTGARFQAKMFVFSLAELLTQRLPMFFDLLWRQFWLLLPLAIYGLVRFRNRTLNIFLFLCFLANAFYAINYDIYDIFVYFIPSYLVVAIYIGKGLEAIRSRLPGKARAPATLLLAAVPLIFLALNYNTVNQRNNTADAARTRSILQTVEHDAVIISPNYHYSEYFWYYLLGEDTPGRNVHILYKFSPEAVSAYLRGEQSFDLPSRRANAPFGLPVYGVSPDQQKLLEEAGLTVQPASNDLYLVSD